MNRKTKILMLTMCIGIFTAKASYSQHTNNDHSKSEQKIEKTEEDLPSGLLKVKQHKGDDMQEDCCKSNTKNNMAMDCCKASDKHTDMKNHNKDVDSSKSSKNFLVREGEIDLKVIDKNKDGKVYQDPMDWNVISDEAGECPLCGMTLKEVTLEKAKENLIKYNFKVKE